MSSNFRFSILGALLVTAVVAFALFAVPLVPPPITAVISFILVVFLLGLCVQVSIGLAIKKLLRGRSVGAGRVAATTNRFGFSTRATLRVFAVVAVLLSLLRLAAPHIASFLAAC
jgi:hypothetical protein